MTRKSDGGGLSAFQISAPDAFFTVVIRALFSPAETYPQIDKICNKIMALA
jgi:hypothetical protein